jgi:hypothetical protein
MAENQVNINLSLLDQQGTIKKRTAEVENLNNQLDKTQKLASNAFAATGTKTGAQALRATEAPDSTVRLQRTVVSTGMQDSTRDQTRPTPRRATYGRGGGGSNEDYTIAGGITGRGGASARDFADQARGLGGLVRLYAEYAANLFAVSAAFSSLREAMNTDIMIRGMEQLGAASGSSLVGMTKSFELATDGMVSFREAAEAVTKATTSGMGQDQVMDIAKVAKGASQALGLNMGDAVSRLTRGITKLEPELLDELGIFTKLDKAVTDYARSVGKSESQLTDFERRQAFANAVLKEGKDKFAEIAQEGNPYDKLLATLKNTAQNILSVVNTVVGPIAKLLADNTALIGIAITALTARLVSKVFPVLSNYRDFLQQTAIDSAARAKEIAESVREREVFGKTGLEAKAGVPQAKQAVEAIQKQIDAQKVLVEQSKKASEPIIKQIALQNELNVLLAKRNQLQDDVKRRGEKAVELGESVRSFSLSAYFQKASAEAAAADAAKMNILANISKGYDVRGVRESFKELADLVNQNSAALGAWGRMATYASGATIILGQALGQLAGYFARFLKVIGVILVTFDILNKIFSSNEKESKKFSATLDELNNNVETAADVNEKYKNSLRIESVLAYGKALDGLSGSIVKAATDFKNLKGASSWTDELLNASKDLTLGIFGKSAEVKVAEDIGRGIESTINTLGDSPLGKEYQAQVRDILQIDGETLLNKESVTGALKSVKGDVDKFSGALDKLAAASNKVNDEQQKNILYLKGLKEAAQLAEKATQTFMNSLKDSSPLTTMFETNIKYLSQLDKGLRSADWQSVSAAIDSLKDADFAGLFGNAAPEIAKLSDEFQNTLLPEIDSTKLKLQEAEKELTKLKGKWLSGWEGSEANRAMRDQQNIVDGLKARLPELQQQIMAMNNVIATAISASVIQQSQKVFQKFKLELQKLDVEQQKYFLSKAPVETIEGARALNKLEKETIDIETKLINANYDLADSLDQLNLTITQDRDAREIERLKKEGTASFIDMNPEAVNTANMSASEKTLFRLETRARGLEEIKRLLSDPKTSPEALESQLTKFPEMFGAFNRKMTARLKAREADFKKQRSDFDLAFKEIDIAAKQATDTLQFELNYAKSVVAGIAMDTPQVIAANIQFLAEQTNKEISIIETARNAKLQKAEEIYKKRGQAGEAEYNASVKLINTEADRLRKAAELQSTNDKILQQRELEAQKLKRTLDLESEILKVKKAGLLGNTLEQDKQRQEIERQERLNQFRKTTEVELNKGIASAQDKLAEFDRTNARQIMGPGGEILPQSLSSEGQAARTVLEASLAGEKDKLAIARQNFNLNEHAINLQNDYSNGLKEQGEIIAKNQLARDAVAIVEDQSFETARHQLALDQQRFEMLRSYGLIVGQNARQQEADLKIREIILQRDQELLANLREREQLEENLLQARYRAVGITPGSMDYGYGTGAPEENILGKATGAEVTGAQGALMKNIAAADRLRQTSGQSINLIEKDLLNTDRMRNYEQAFSGYFNSMADAIENWSRTGKMNSKELFNSLISDLARYELKLAMTALYANAIRPLFNSALSFFGLPMLPVGKAKGDVMMGGMSLPGYAMGGVFDQGRATKYARGGIVDQPVLFPMKKGVGLMGEAGPEAIMPLRKDAGGNLGVIAYARGGILPVGRTPNGEMGVNMGAIRGSRESQPQYNHETVIHNYSGQPVTEKVSMNSRGGRKTEYFIGEAAAGETARNGGSMQNAIRNTYGLQPRLIRR